MIRMGCYDVFDKWEIVCHSWAGEAIDVGLNRHGSKPALLEWQWAAFRGGSDACLDYLRLKCEALNYGYPAATGADDRGEESELSRELSRLLREIGYGELRTRCLRSIEGIKASGIMGSPDGLTPGVAAEGLGPRPDP